MIFFMSFAVLHGQVAGRGAIGLRGGFQIGIHEPHNHFKTWVGLDNLKSESKNNPNLVLYGAFGFSNYIGIQTELNFMFSQGVRGAKGGRSVEMFYTSLDMPLLLRINFLPSQTRFGILGGPLFTFPLGKINTKYEGFLNHDEKGEIDAPNFGFAAGLFFGHPIDFGFFMLDFRYLMDFGQSFEKHSGNFDFGVMQRRGIVIGLGVEFTI